MAQTAYDNAIGNMLDAIDALADAGLKAQADLPHGFASLNPSNVHELIDRLDNQNGPTALVLSLIAATSSKTAKFTFLKQLSEAVSAEKAVFGHVGDQSLKGLLDLTSVAADLLGFSQFSKALEIGQSGADTLVAYGNLLSHTSVSSRTRRIPALEQAPLSRDRTSRPCY